MNQIDKAIEKLNNAIKIDPDYPRAYFNLAMCHLLQGKLEEGKKDYKKALSIDKDPKNYETEEHIKDLEDALIEHPAWRDKLRPAIGLLQNYKGDFAIKSRSSMK